MQPFKYEYLYLSKCSPYSNRFHANAPAAPNAWLIPALPFPSTAGCMFPRAAPDSRIEKPATDAANPPVLAAALELLRDVPVSVVEWWQRVVVVKHKPSLNHYYWVLAATGEGEARQPRKRLHTLADLRAWCSARFESAPLAEPVPATPPPRIREGVLDSAAGRNMLVSCEQFLVGITQLAQPCVCNTGQPITTSSCCSCKILNQCHCVCVFHTRVVPCVCAPVHAADPPKWTVHDLENRSLGGTSTLIFQCSECLRCMPLPMYQGRHTAQGWQSYAARAGLLQADLEDPDLPTTRPVPSYFDARGNDIGRQCCFSYFVSSSEMSYSCYRLFCFASALIPYSKECYRLLTSEFRCATTTLLSLRMGLATEDLKSPVFASEIAQAGGIVVAADGCYETLKNSGAGTFAAMNKHNHCVIAASHYSLVLGREGATLSSKGGRVRAEGLTVGFAGSAHAAESFMAQICFRDLQARGVPVGMAVTDGDANAAAAITLVYRQAKTLSCLNHVVKNATSALMTDSKAIGTGKSRQRQPATVSAAVAKPAIGVPPAAPIPIIATAPAAPIQPEGDVTAAVDSIESYAEHPCGCVGKNHCWLEHSCCGCLHDSHCKYVQGLTHAIACTVKSSDELIVRLRLLPEHMRGNHAKCSGVLHATRMCIGPCKCPRRSCKCGLCEAGKPRKCFGDPIDPPASCEYAVPWASSISPVTCHGHLYQVYLYCEKLCAKAAVMIVNGKKM